MFSHSTRPAHFFIPLVMIIIGGALSQFDSWRWVGYLVVVLAGYVSHWLYKMGIEHEKTERIRENHELYATIEKIDAEARAQLGLEPSKTTTQVVVDKSSLVGNYFSRSYRELPLPPWKLRTFAKGIKAGRPFHIREWTPIKDGRLLSDGEWRDLVKFLKQPDPESKEIAFVVQRHPTNERKGFDWTAVGQEWLDDVVNLMNTAPLPQ